MNKMTRNICIYEIFFVILCAQMCKVDYWC